MEESVASANRWNIKEKVHTHGIIRELKKQQICNPLGNVRKNLI